MTNKQQSWKNIDAVKCYKNIASLCCVTFMGGGLETSGADTSFVLLVKRKKSSTWNYS